MRLLLALLASTVALTFAAPQSFAQEPAKTVKANTGSKLQDAYRREFAFLEAEKRALQERLTAQAARAKDRVSKANAEIRALQDKVVHAAGLAERLEEQVLTADREAEVLETSEGVTEDILLRAEAALKKGGIALPGINADVREEVVGQLRFVFESAPRLLSDQAAVRIEKGAYFDSAGNKIEGDILRIGNIASYGLVAGAQGVLAPAGENHLKLWETATGANAASQLARGEAPSTLPLFLYESLETGVTAKVDKSVMEVIRTGGLIAWVIVGLGGIALLMVFIRGLLLLLASRGSKTLVEPVMLHVDAGDIDKGLRLATSANTPIGRVLSATLANVERPREQLEDIVAEAVLQEQPRLSRFGSSILVAAAVSPLLGLLGTVTGMISTFDVITEFGTGNPKLLSGGISEALVTTELGLIVAIPALLLGHMLSGWSDAIRDRLDASALTAVNRSTGLMPPEPETSSVLPSARAEQTKGVAA